MGDMEAHGTGGAGARQQYTVDELASRGAAELFSHPLHGNLGELVEEEEPVETYKFVWHEPEILIPELKKLPEGVNTVNDMGAPSAVLVVQAASDSRLMMTPLGACFCMGQAGQR